MRGRTIFSLVTLCGLCLALVTSSGLAQGSNPQVALSTAFTYQGRLTDGGGVANGRYDFEFRLFDAPSGGNQVGSAVSKDDGTVANGLFTLQLDFGNVFGGTLLYLEVGVRPGDSSGGIYHTGPAAGADRRTLCFLRLKGPLVGV